ncbi:ATP-binding protein [Algicella marina]|uniref:histidine kinase n=1 Tax=Algicella marina TaxID=2683284 RepID=A0A6P1SW27_9RHOB|nr:ATP-binding protein [Algicella marina]QHQ34874.1 response regulator [Algicella marina]
MYADVRVGDIPLGPLSGLIVAVIVYFTIGKLQDTTESRAFNQYFDSSDSVVFLVSRRGSILRTNSKAGNIRGLLANYLATGTAESETLIYSLGREAAVKGQSTRMILWKSSPASILVRQLGNGAQIWSISEMNTSSANMPARDVGDGSAKADVPRQEDDLFQKLPVGLVRINLEGRMTYLNAAAQNLLDEEAVPGKRFADHVEGLGRSIPERLEDAFAGRAQSRSEVARCHRDGSEVFLQVNMIRVVEDDDPLVLAVVSDATELKTLEAQFVQSQKMQAVGQLAGGIAHDFNNLLTAIHGHCDLLLLRHDHGDPEHGDLIQIRQNANRAAALVRQLLAFSRKQTLRLNVLHLYDTMAELAHLLNRLLGEKVQLNLENLEDIWAVRVDERQLEQVIVNLVVNARDAMGEGGVVTLRTRNLELDEALRRDRANVPAGRYSVIEVHDTGEGIPPNLLNKIFEPFYTTKRVGEGTGLGLSTAYGIIKQSGGFIFVDSALGQGTCFTIYLPVYDGPAVAEAGANLLAPSEEESVPDLTGRGVVLLVEDEAPVRSFAARALRMRGYEVLEADCGEAALALVEENDTHVDLFVSDVVMPGIDGPSWVRQALQLRPDVSTIFVSGYAEDAFKDGHEEIPRSSFLAKPFSLNDLTGRVREHMDRYGQNRLH